MSSLTCVVCDKTAPVICSTCKSSAYCSMDCIAKDVPLHKGFCHPFTSFTSTHPRPVGSPIAAGEFQVEDPQVAESTVFRLGLLFPVNATTPQYVWVKCHQTQYRGIVDEIAEWTEFLQASGEPKEVNTYPGHAKLDHTIQIWGGDGGDGGDLESNQSVSALSSECKKRNWRGPIIALRFHRNVQGDEDSGGLYQDMTPADGGVAQMFFAQKRAQVKVHDIEMVDNEVAAAPARPSNKIQGVVIHCLGQTHLKEKKYVAMHISGYTTELAYSSKISQHMGVPLHLIKVPSPQSYAYEADFDPYENYEPYYLVMNANPTDDDDTWAFANMQKWDLKVGSVLVVRADHKDITPHQVEALVYYCRYKLFDQMHELADGSEYFYEKELEAEKSNYEIEVPEVEDERRKFIEEHMCRAKFEEFFEEFKKEKVEEGDESWANATSPYSV